MTLADRMKSTVRRWLPPPPPLKQGAHPDPRDPGQTRPDPDSWSPSRLRAYASAEMDAFRDGLRLPGHPDIREAVLDDLSTFHGIDVEQCVRRCVDWESWSVEEWSAADRSTPEAITAFYRTTESWAFDLLWYAYLQCVGYGVPESVVAVRFLAKQEHGSLHLDFGSGVGVTSQLFARCGYRSDLADISTSLLRFARFRLERRDEPAGFLDLNDTPVEPDRYDVITALDTLAHVPDIDATAAMLHAALRPGGWLITNFDVRPPSQENAWHLYDDDLGLRAAVQRAGFELAGRPGELMAYRRMEPGSRRHRMLMARDSVLLTSGPRRMVRRAARQAAGTVYGLRRS